MKKKTSKKTRSTTKKPGKAAATPPSPVQQALQVTWLLKGHLKNMQISYIRVGALLARVRDENMYSTLHHADIEGYARDRLNLGRTSLYRYLQIYDWIRQSHKEWLEPHPKGFIPDLSDVGDLMWIERELTRKELSPAARKELEALRKKALAGQLTQSELEKWRKGGQTTSTRGLKSFLSSVRTLRKRGVALASMPADAIAHLDAAIEILGTAVGVSK